MENKATVRCNYNIVWIEGFKKCALSYTYTKEKSCIINLNPENCVLGGIIDKVLSNIIEIDYSKEMVDELIREAQFDISEQEKYLQRTYGYKKVNDIYSGMMSCSIYLSDNQLRVSPWKRRGPGAWDGMDKEHDIITRFPIPDELLGAAIRFAFTRCLGSGAIKVVKLLFPTGIPESLDEYLASVNPNYKNWLISAGE